MAGILDNGIISALISWVGDHLHCGYVRDASFLKENAEVFGDEGS